MTVTDRVAGYQARAKLLREMAARARSVVVKAGYLGLADQFEMMALQAKREAATS
jgi:hypothetical protein